MASGQRWLNNVMDKRIGVNISGKRKRISVIMAW
jgi:hypothetical protein